MNQLSHGAGFDNRTRARRQAIVALILGVLGFAGAMFVISSSLGGCGGNQRMKVVQSSMLAVDTARDVFLVYVQEHQAKIVADAKSREEAEQKVAAFKAKRDKVDEGFSIAYDALKLAVKKEDEVTLQAAVDAVKDLLVRLAHLKNGDAP